MKGVRRFFCLVVITVSVNLLVGVAHAQSQRNPWEKFSVAVGGFLTETDTSIEIESRSLGVGAAIDIENVLGVERSFSTYRIDARYRFGQSRRHEVEFHYFSSDRNGVKVLEDDLQIGDVFLPAGTGVVTDFEMRFANVDYVYNFLMDDRVRAGVSVGLHTSGIRLEVSESGGRDVEQQDFTAPLPMIGLRAEVLLAPHWRFASDVNLSYLKYDGYTGRLSDFFIGFEYARWEHFGIGAGVNAVSYYIDSDVGNSVFNFNGELKFQLTGFMLYGKYFF